MNKLQEAKLRKYIQLEAKKILKEASSEKITVYEIYSYVSINSKSIFFNVSKESDAKKIVTFLNKFEKSQVGKSIKNSVIKKHRCMYK